MFKELTRVRENCRECISNVPMQLNAPPEPLPDVQYPFQQVCGDYMQVAGDAYLVLVDRYSGWPSVIKAKKALAAELVTSIREFFQVFGVCEEFTSDGGKQFTSRELELFFASWSVKHICPSQ